LSLSETQTELQGRSSNINKLFKPCVVRSINDAFLLAKYLFRSWVSKYGMLAEEAHSK